MPTSSRLAAVDLGSNSFRLEIARAEGGQLQRMEYHKEVVRQGNGLDAERRLSLEAMERGWRCLARFGERLAGFEREQVRAVATQTLREARNRDDFLSRAEEILGFAIDVISGREEARLIYQGVVHLLPHSPERRLVVDIGGRSTEVITGQGYVSDAMESYRVGSVAWSMRYFPGGALTARNFSSAEIAAKAVLDDALDTHARAHWDTAYGSSGTVGAVAATLFLAGRAPAEGVIDRAGLQWLREKLIKARQAEAIRLDGISEERKPVIAGGLSVLLALFDLLGIEELHHAHGALRHGALFDLMDRSHESTDVRQAAIERLAARFNADAAQAERVARAAQHLLAQLGGTGAQPGGEEQRQVQWAARLHEIGSRISHADYHKHGAYILDNTDVQGFSMHELHVLSQLVLGHRGKLRKVEARFGDAAFMRQLLALRLAVILCHARQNPVFESLRLAADEDGGGFTVTLPRRWAASWPQSAHLLREEVVAWQKTPWRLHVHEQGSAALHD